MRPRIETDTTRKHGGMHNRVGFRAFSKLITENTFLKARLYHLVLKAPKKPAPHPTVEDYRKAADAITRLLRGNNIDCFGKGAWEVNEERGLHFHFMIVVEAQYGNVDYWLRVTEDGDLKTALRKLGVDVHVAPPGNDMHRVGGNRLGKMPLYQYVTKSGPKLEDAIKRISYIYKTDTKDDSMKRVYYSTRNRKAKPAAPATLEAPAVEAQQIERADVITNTNNGEDNERPTSQIRFQLYRRVAGTSSGQAHELARDTRPLAQPWREPLTDTDSERPRPYIRIYRIRGRSPSTSTTING